MTYFLADTRGYLDDAATISGWGDFAEWAEPLGGVVADFIEHGFTEFPGRLARQLASAVAPNESAESVRAGLVRNARRARDILILTDGVGGEDVPPRRKAGSRRRQQHAPPTKPSEQPLTSTGGRRMESTAKGEIVVRLAEYIPKLDADQLPAGLRGIYALFRHRGMGKTYDVVYVGLSRAGIRARLRAHRRDRRKAALWTHFSAFEVGPRFADVQLRELEGLFRHIYRRDTRANSLNKQETHGPLKALRVQDLKGGRDTDDQEVLSRVVEARGGAHERSRA